MARTLFFLPCSKNNLTSLLGNNRINVGVPLALGDPSSTTNNISSSSSASFSLVAAQIIWFGIGLSLLADIAETLLHWHHLLAVALSSALMIASTWFGLRSIVILSTLVVPAMLAVVYFALTQTTPEEGLLDLWTQMVRVKSMEYFSGLLIIMGGFIKGSSSKTSLQPAKKIDLKSVVACLGFGAGNGLVVLTAVNGAVADGTEIVPILAQQGSSILGLCLLGLSAKTSSFSTLSNCGRLISEYTKIPLRLVVLFAGTVCAVYFDWCSQYMSVGWLQYMSMCLPPLILLLMGSSFSAMVSSLRRALTSIMQPFAKVPA